jgi:hypothetical protein
MERHKERWQRGRPRSKLESNNKKSLRELWGLDWTHLFQDSNRWKILPKAVTNRLVP